MANVVLVDPLEKSVRRANLSIQEIREWIGCDLLEIVRCGNDTLLWIDEEGMLRNEPTLWVLAGRQLIAGKAVFSGEGLEDEGFGDVGIPGEVLACSVTWIPERLQASARDSVPLGGFYLFGDKEGEARAKRRAEEGIFSATMLAIQGEGAEFIG
jgi:hypothetical protein